MNCPLCGARTSYVGTFAVDCTGRGCVNFRPPTPRIIPAAVGCVAWAVAMRRAGYTMQYRLIGNGDTWTTAEPNETALEIPGEVEYTDRNFEWRIRPNNTSDPSVTGTLAWALLQQANGLRVGWHGPISKRLHPADPTDPTYAHVLKGWELMP